MTSPGLSPMLPAMSLTMPKPQIRDGQSVVVGYSVLSISL